MGKIIAFANQKGGVGKTTTCINLAAFVAVMSKKVLIVDMDPQGNATSGVGIEKNSSMKTIYNVIDGDCSVKEAILQTFIENLDIIPATVDLAGAEIELVQMSSREKIIKNILNRIIENYDYIFIDCPPSLGLLTVNALTAAHSIVIPIQCEFFALEGLSQLMNTIRLIKHHLNPALDVEGVILTMKDNRSNLINEVSNEIIKFFGKKVYDTFIPRNIRLAEAPSHGQPIVTYDIHSKGASAYKELAEEFLERNNDDYVKITKSTKIIKREPKQNEGN
ncbi:MAG: AAA family ATPase [Clostridia bacterium]|jgi:chromosome partitioning protein|nr:AAA family ATPase [Clostridia bacterium]MDD3232454.1 AAA family ATPase [Clostridia bacterium]